MVPIDGTYTMSLDGISEITRRLRASVVLPMHRFATPLDEFMRGSASSSRSTVRSERTLEDFAGDAAVDADGDYSRRGLTHAKAKQATRKIWE